MFIKFLFISSAILSVASSIGVVVTKNIMHSCICLLGTLLGVAGLYATMGADFVAVTQVMVYVGGVVILMLFAVMLTGGKDFKSKAQKLLGLPSLMGNKFSYIVGITFSLVFGATLYKIISGAVMVTKPGQLEGYSSTVEGLGKLLITDHVVPFEVSSVLLLGALVGAAIIARPKRGK